LSAWGGHNGQSHNHNDVGNYIVYQNGRPALIDVGRPTYTRQTFSRDRYKIWAMQSAYHNLPTVNGQMQGVGTQYAAGNVDYHADDKAAQLKLDLAPAYPSSAKIVSWDRTIRLVRGQSVQVGDDFTFHEPSAEIVQHLITPCAVELLENSRFRLRDGGTGTDLLVQYDPPGLQIEVEIMELKDAKLAEMWGPELRRVLLRADKPQSRATWTVKITPAK
jgi:Heparinase II/III-like protein